MKDKVIYKYHIPLQDRVEVIMPKGAKILSAKIISEKIFIWALVSKEAELKHRIFHILGTGHEFNPRGLKHIDTLGSMGPGFIWHLFDGGEY